LLDVIERCGAIGELQRVFEMIEEDLRAAREGSEPRDLLSADRRVGASQNSLPRFHQRDPAVALPNFDITTMRKICHLLFCIIVVHAA